jgi:aspartate/methionine/tyrosine aminotransferase
VRAADRIISRNRPIVLSNLAAARQFCERYPHLFQWLEPQAGSIAFPRWRGPIAVDELCRRAVEESGIMIVPGSIFEYASQSTHLSQHFRVGLGRRNLPQVLARLEEFMRGAGFV